MRFISTTVAILAALLTQSAANAADMHTVAPGEVAKIEAHGVCRMVRNTGDAAIMVPARKSSEWSAGSNAFLQNLLTMPGVAVSPCASLLVATELAWWRGQGPTYNKARGEYTLFLSKYPDQTASFYDVDGGTGTNLALDPEAHCAEAGREPGIYSHYIHSGQTMFFEFKGWSCA